MKLTLKEYNQRKHREAYRRLHRPWGWKNDRRRIMSIVWKLCEDDKKRAKLLKYVEGLNKD